MKLTVLLLALLVSVSYQTDAENEEKELKVGGHRDPRFFFLFNTLHFTTTTWTTTTSTATTATVVSCIPASLFSAGSSTVACRRRRGIMEDSGLELEAISPSERQEVVATELPAETQRQPEFDLRSSLDQVTDDHDHRHIINKRFLYTYITTTLTSTYTSLAFASTALTSTVILAGDSQLLCLPAGYTAC